MYYAILAVGEAVPMIEPDTAYRANCLLQVAYSNKIVAQAKLDSFAHAYPKTKFVLVEFEL